MKNATLEHFGLVDGQISTPYRYKNLWWELKTNGGECLDPRCTLKWGHRHSSELIKVGYGDLSDDQIIQIQERLQPGEEFIGWNEHHGTEWQQTKSPMIRITHDNIMFRENIVNTKGR